MSLNDNYTDYYVVLVERKEVDIMQYLEFEVSGKYALFSDVFTSIGGEKCTMPIPTYAAIRGIAEAGYWKPTFEWIIDAVRVMNPIETVTKGVRLYTGWKGNQSDLALYTYLKDVRYQVRMHLEWNMNREDLEQDRKYQKHMNIAKKSFQAGGRRDIFLGTKECQGNIEPCVFGEGKGAYDNEGVMSYGLMYHGITYTDTAIREEDKDYNVVRLWPAKMVDGVITYPRPEDCIITRKLSTSARGINYKVGTNFSLVGED